MIANLDIERPDARVLERVPRERAGLMMEEAEFGLIIGDPLEDVRWDCDVHLALLNRFVTVAR